MRVALIVPGFSADEDDWCIPALRDLVGALARTDDVTVLTLRYPHRAGRYAAFGARVIALGGATRRGASSLGLWRRALAALRAEHRRRPFDLLHAFWATESGLLATLGGRLLGAPAVVSLAGGELTGLRDIGYGDQLATIQRLKVGLALRGADVVTGGSAYLIERAAPRLGRRPPGRLRRIPLGVDTGRFRPGPGAVGDDCPALIHVASLVPVKDQAMLLLAVALVRHGGVPVRLRIAGEGPLEHDLRGLADALGIGEAVEFLGAVPHDRLPDLYRSGTLFVLSSRHEAQGMAVLEAAACGLPVVGTAAGVIPEFAPGAAVAVPGGDAGALAAAIGALLSDPARRAALGRAGRARVATDYSLERATAQFRELYAGLAGARPR